LVLKRLISIKTSFGCFNQFFFSFFRFSGTEHLVQMIGDSVSEFGIGTAADYDARKMYTIALFDSNESFTVEKLDTLNKKKERGIMRMSK